MSAKMVRMNEKRNEERRKSTLRKCSQKKTQFKVLYLDGSLRWRIADTAVQSDSPNALPQNNVQRARAAQGGTRCCADG